MPRSTVSDPFFKPSGKTSVSTDYIKSRDCCCGGRLFPKSSFLLCPALPEGKLGKNMGRQFIEQTVEVHKLSRGALIFRVFCEQVKNRRLEMQETHVS